MKPGTKPMPRNMRMIKGGRDVGRDKPANPVVEPQVSAPPAPEFLNDEERDVFSTTARKLAGMRIMTDADVDALVMYSRNWVDAQRARRELRGKGMIVASPNGYPIINPHLTIARKAEDRCLRIMVEFGLTPSSRNRVSQ